MSNMKIRCYWYLEIDERFKEQMKVKKKKHLLEVMPWPTYLQEG